MNTIPIDKIISEGNVRSKVVNGKNPAYKALKNNIAAIGVQTPITYRKSGDNYVVINDKLEKAGYLRVAFESYALPTDPIPGTTQTAQR